MSRLPFVGLELGLIACAACSPPASGSSVTNDAACDTDTGFDGPAWEPKTIIDSSVIPVIRNWKTWRGVIHFHSVYSNDACDSQPFRQGKRDEQCFVELRTALCDTRQDFGFLTDHADSFAAHEFPEVLLYAKGDRLIARQGEKVANYLSCGGGREVLLMAGSENETMPLGLERHVGATLDERLAAYSDKTPAGLLAFQAAGALAFLQHTEEWEPEYIAKMPIDGIEIYNTHFNLTDKIGVVFDLLKLVADDSGLLPEMDLALLPLFAENERALERWAIAAEQKRLPGILATDVHRNTLKTIAPDGERIDSYRRLIRWFSNYVLLPDTPVDDRGLKRAIGQGRLYGVFHYLGYPIGFDFHAQADGQIYEMGQAFQSTKAELAVSMPTIYKLDPQAPHPEISARLLRAEKGQWKEVARSGSDFATEVSSGAYRVEVRMTPHHLKKWLGREPLRYLREVVWIYSNPIYVGLSGARDATREGTQSTKNLP